MAELQTRPPTGKVAYPLILVEGEEKAGKSYALAQLAASPRVGRTFILDTGDGTMDEYASLGPYEILIHDGTWTSMIDQIEAATRAPKTDGRPNVVGIDSGSNIWTMLKLWTDERARTSRTGRAALKDDPNAEIDPTMNLWNDAKGRWGKMLHLLRSFDGIGVILAQGSEVTKVENGQPTRETTWSVEAEKTTPAVASAWVRIRRPHQARLIGVRSLTIDVPDGGLALPDEGMLDHLVFEILGAGDPTSFAPLTSTPAIVGTKISEAKQKVLARVKATHDGFSAEDAAAEARRLWQAYGLPSGEGEIPTDRLTEILLDIAEGRIPGSDEPDAPDPEPLAAPEAAQEEPAPTPAPEEPDPETAAQEPRPDLHRLPDGRTLTIEGREVTTEEAVSWINAAKGRDLQTIAKALDLPSSGLVDELRARLREHLGIETPMEEVLDVPPGWVEDICICGEPMMHQPGKYRDTVTHLNPKLNDEHQADAPF